MAEKPTYEELEGRIRELEKVVSLQTRSQERDSQYRLHFANSPHPIVVVDSDGTILDINAVAAANLGMPADQCIGESIFSIQPDIDGALHRIYKHIVETGESVVRDDRLDLSVGTRWFTSLLQPVQDEDGNRYGVQVLSYDITERRQAEKALVESKAIAEGVIQAMQDGFTELDTSGVHLRVNAAFLRMTGFSENEIIGTGPPHPYWPPEERSAIESAFQRTVRKENSEFELVFMKSNGARFPVVVSPSYLEDEDGNITRYFATVKDITERVQAERALRESVERARALLNAPTEAMILMDRNGAILALNERSAQALDRTTDEVIGTCVWELLPDEVRSVRRSKVEDVFRSGRPVSWEDTKANRTFSNSMYPVFDAQGQVELVANYGKDITEERHARSRLMDSERLFQAFMDHYPAHIYIKDSSLRHIYANRTALDFMERATEEWYGSSSKDFFPVELAEKIEAQDKLVLDKGMVVRGEVAIPSDSGSMEYRIDQKFPITMPSGETLIGGISYDVSREREAESQLAETKRRFEAAFQQHFQFMAILSTDGTILEINDLAIEATGYRKEDYVGSLFWNSPHWKGLPGWSDTIRKEFEHALSADGPVFFEEKYQKANGDVGFDSASYFVIRDSEGNAEYVIGQATDITEEKEREEALSKSEILIDSTSDAIITTDLDGSILFWNRGAENLYGYTKEEVVGGPISIIYSDGDKERLGRLIGELITGNDVDAFEMTTVDRHGDEKRIIMSLTTLRDSSGDIAEVVGFGKDVTEQQRLERNLKQAQKMEAIGTLAGGIAHDFNNILGIILACTELSLSEARVGSSMREHLVEARRATDRAKDLVRQILTFSRQGEEDAHPLVMGTVIKDALRMLRATLPSTIEIKQNVDMNTGLIRADSTSIHQVIMNLATNAAHAMSGNGGVLEVTVERVAVTESDATQRSGLSPGPYVRLAVSDTGHGIEPGITDRLFDPYFTTKGPGEGTGLGLSVVHGIVQSHGGSVEVQSKLGVGTTFQIYFPRVASSASGPDSLGSEVSPIGSEHILVVDDEPALARTIALSLERLGYSVTTRTSSIDALAAFRESSEGFDLVITDQTMPNMTGVVLASQMMAMKPGVPIILCTGFGSQIDEDRALNMGIEAFLHKPVSPVEVARTIRTILDTKG